MTSITEDQRAVLAGKLPNSGILSIGYDAPAHVLTVQTGERDFLMFAGITPTDFAAVCAMTELNPKLAPTLNAKPITLFVDATLGDYAGAKPTEFVELPAADPEQA